MDWYDNIMLRPLILQTSYNTIMERYSVLWGDGQAPGRSPASCFLRENDTFSRGAVQFTGPTPTWGRAGGLSAGPVGTGTGTATAIPWGRVCHHSRECGGRRVTTVAGRQHGQGHRKDLGGARKGRGSLDGKSELQG